MSPLYDSILQKVECLSQAEQLRLISQLAERLCAQATSEAPASILELQGLGKDVWRGVDAQTHVDHERSSWSG
jgi:hypothetical protein